MCHRWCPTKNLEILPCRMDIQEWRSKHFQGSVNNITLRTNQHKIVNYNNWVASFLGSPHILQAAESWAGPGNEANNWAPSAMCKPSVYVPDIIACDEYLRTEKNNQILAGNAWKRG